MKVFGSRGIAAGIVSGFLLFTGAAAQPAPTTQPTTRPEVKPEPCVAKGRVTDASGKPIAGANVYLRNTVFYSSSAELKTDKDGNYRVEIPRGVWHVTANITREYNKKKYRFDLAPEIAEDFANADGGVRNFVWKLTGEKPDGLGTYGDSVVAYAQPGDWSFERKDVELTLTPDGPLVDGSEGKAIRAKVASTGDGDAVTDVPLGRYVIQARLAPEGKKPESLLVRVRSKGEFGPSVKADFETPKGPTLPIHRIEVEVKRQ